MKYLTEEEISKIRENANIVDIIESYGIKLEKKGKDNYLCLCPFHDDHNPNMIVSEKKQIYKCFGGCSAGGNVFKFVEDYENVSFIESVKIVAQKSHQDFNFQIKNKYNDSEKYTKEYEIMDLSLKFFQNNIASNDGKKAKEYLEKRKVNENIINNFKIGLSFSQNSLKKFLESKNIDLELAYNIGLVNKNGIEYFDVFNDRIMIPIFNQNGKLCGYTGRCYLKDEENKYVNYKETVIYKKSEILFNYYNAKNEINKLRELVIVEGNMDAIMLCTYGIKNVCALMGVNLSSYQIDFIKKQRLKVILMLDSDNAGSSATLKVGDALLEKGIDVRVVRLSGCKDPDEYVRKNGVDALKDNITNARKFIDFKLDALKTGIDLTSIEDVTAYLKNALSSLKFTEGIERELIINRLANEYNIDASLLRDSIKSKIPKKEDKPIKIKKSKYEVLSSKLIYAMLLHKEYYRMYMNNLGYLKEKKERMTVGLIAEYIDKYNKIDIADFIDYVLKYEEVSDFVNKIIGENYEEDISENEYEKLINAVSKEIDLDDIKNLKEKIKNEQDINEKVKLIERLTKLKKEVDKNERD
mgnify:CR=1 FL=1